MDGVEPVERIRHRVGLVERERVVRLRVDVDADDVEPGAVVADRRAAGTAEQVEKFHCHGDRPSCLYASAAHLTFVSASVTVPVVRPHNLRQ